MAARRAPAPSAAGPIESVRLDKWLWAARFFKTRALAAEAIGGGKVEVNGDRVKRARALRPGDQVRLRLGPYEYRVTVTALSERRLGPALAAGLYQEDPEARTRRERLAEQHRMSPHDFRHGEGRPTKKDRRELQRLKRGRAGD